MFLQWRNLSFLLSMTIERFLENYRFYEKPRIDKYSRVPGEVDELCYLRHYDALCIKIKMWLTTCSEL